MANCAQEQRLHRREPDPTVRLIVEPTDYSAIFFRGRPRLAGGLGSGTGDPLF
jgi:hypothetical protein